jgi:hypothetical protein
MNKILKAATTIPNDNTFIALEDDHGPRKNKHNNRNNHNKPRYNTTKQSNVYLLREITQQKGKTGSKTQTTHAP